MRGVLVASGEEQAAFVVGVVLPASTWAVIRFVKWLERATQLGILDGEDEDSARRSTQRGDVHVSASPQAVAFVQNAGGMVFVRAYSTRCCRLSMTVLRASCDPPSDALTFLRFDVGPLLLFLDPTIRELPNELMLEVRGRLRPRIAAYWDGVAYRV